MKKIQEKLSENFVMRSCFFDELKGKYVWIFLAAKFAVMSIQVGRLEVAEEDEANEAWRLLTSIASECLWALWGSLIAFAVLMIVTFFLNKSLQCGYGLGNIILKRSKAESRRVNANLTTGLVHNDAYAMTCFAAWISVQGLLVQFR